MKKIPTLFVRDFANNATTGNFVINEINPGCEWVKDGEGWATRKWDGIAHMHRDGKWFKRYDAKVFTIDQKTGERKNHDRKPPEGFEPLMDAPDPHTGHLPGWVPCKLPEDKLLFATVALYSDKVRTCDGTYELVGPKVGTRAGANPESLTEHWLYKHGDTIYLDAPRTFDELREYFLTNDIEGIVWHHPDGRMVKLKGTDFGIVRRK